MDVFDRRGNKTCDYVLLRSEQVGALSGLSYAGIERHCSLSEPL